VSSVSQVVAYDQQISEGGGDWREVWKGQHTYRARFIEVCQPKTDLNIQSIQSCIITDTHTGRTTTFRCGN